MLKKINFSGWFLSAALLGLLSLSHVSDSWAGGITSPGAARGRNADITSLQNLHGTSGYSDNTSAGLYSLDSLYVNNQGYGRRNTALGTSSGQFLRQGSDDVIVGYGALSNCSGACSDIVAIGSLAANAATATSSFVAVGYNSLGSATYANGDVAVGPGTLLNDAGGSNTAVGSGAGGSISSGYNNLFLGYGAKNSSTNDTGHNNLCVGSNACNSAPANISNYLEISTYNTTTPLVTGSFGTTYGSIAGNTFNINGVLTQNNQPVALYLSGTSASIGGGALAAGACSSAAVTVTGATASMAAIATPATYPGAGFDWAGYVSAAGVVTVQICAIVAGTPTASVYNVRVIQ